MASAGRESTNQVYDGKWRRFADWCVSKGIDLLHPTGPQLAEFFEQLSSVEGLAYSTLRGYKASLLSVLAARRPLSIEIERDLGKLFQD
jgi:hypothetical protein